MLCLLKFRWIIENIFSGRLDVLLRTESDPLPRHEQVQSSMVYLTSDFPHFSESFEPDICVSTNVSPKRNRRRQPQQPP